MPAKRYHDCFRSALCALILLPFTLAAAAPPDDTGPSGGLTLEKAQTMAVEADTEMTRLRARARAQKDRAIAAGELPDPSLSLGVANLPVPDLSLSEEPMSQVQLGLRQRFPTRAARRAASTLERARGETFDTRTHQRRLQVRDQLRELWIELQHRQAMLEIIGQRAEVLEELTESLGDRQGADRADQTAVLSSRTRRARLDKRRTDLEAEITDLRAELSRWLDGAPLPRQLATARFEPPEAVSLDNHPELAVAGRRIDEAEQHIAAARAAFRPGWEAAVGVGRRFGDTPMGAPGETLINATVSIDLPLFTKDRQSRRLSAARAEHEAVASESIKVRRELSARYRSARERYADYAELTRRYDESVIPLAADREAAERMRYRNGEQPLQPVLEARLARLEAEYERIELARARDRAASDLIYLGGQ